MPHADEALVEHVVLAVRRRHDHRARSGGAEDHALERREPRRVDVLDDLHQHGRVVAGVPLVLVGQRALEQLDALGLALAHPLHLQSSGGVLQRPRRDVAARDAGERRCPDEPLQELAGAAAEVDDRAGTEVEQDLVDGVVPLGVEGHALLLRLHHLLVLRGLDGLLEVVTELGEAGERGAREPGAPAEVAPGDQRRLGVIGEPALARAHQLVDLVGALPVVLRLVQHGEQHVELVEGVGEPDGAGQPEPDVARVAPLRDRLVERDRLGLDRPAERLEEPVRDVGATAARQHRDRDLERDGGVGELLARPAGAAARGAEHVGHRDAEQRRGGVRPVVDVLREAEVGRVARPRPRQSHGVDVEDERGRAALVGGLGVEDGDGAEGLGELLHPVGVLVEQVAQVGRRGVGGRDGEEHSGIVPESGRSLLSIRVEGRAQRCRRTTRAMSSRLQPSASARAV